MMVDENLEVLSGGAGGRIGRWVGRFRRRVFIEPDRLFLEKRRVMGWMIDDILLYGIDF